MTPRKAASANHPRLHPTKQVLVARGRCPVHRRYRGLRVEPDTECCWCWEIWRTREAERRLFQGEDLL
jgi:hypothetical protein